MRSAPVDLSGAIVASVAAECARRGIPVPALAFEPGRAIVGTAGVTLYEVGTIKPVEYRTGAWRTYVSVDGNISVRDGDKVYRFCSYECRDKFLQRLQEGGRELPPREE